MARNRSINDDELCKLLLLNGSVHNAAVNCNLSESAIYKRLEDHNFRQKLELAGRGALASASTELTLAVSSAVQTLVEICKDQQNNAQVRMLAADRLIQHCAKIQELVHSQRRSDESESWEIKIDAKDIAAALISEE